MKIFICWNCNSIFIYKVLKFICVHCSKRELNFYIDQVYNWRKETMGY